MDIKKAMDSLTYEEKVALVSGREYMCTNSVPRLGIRRLQMADGPHGVRKQKGSFKEGAADTEAAICFPTAAATASSFNPENTYLMGQAMAEEALHYGVDILLGPGMNIKRNPKLGRNFEYFSEDPLLSAKMASGEVRGIQSMGVSACIKHYALNNAENYRFVGDSIVDMRAAREIYLRAFEKVIKEARPDCVMSAYNKALGSYCAENKWLLNDLLREEFGYEGVVMTDWGGMHDRVNAALAGCDLEMPGDSKYARWQLLRERTPELDEAINQSVARILSLIGKHEDKNAGECDFAAHHALAAKIAEDSAVLMKNDGGLPLRENERLLIIGELFRTMRYQGSGSSMVNATTVVSPKNAFDSHNVQYDFHPGYLLNGQISDELLAEALTAAEGAEKILLFIGLTDYLESEGCDRESITLDDGQIKLIGELSKLGKPIVAVLFGGAPFEIPMPHALTSILNMYLPGQAGGEAVYNLLFGNVSPSGKLPESWPVSYNAVPDGENYSKMPIEVYKESVFVGYRYYLSHPNDVLFPFGHGLSYAKFEYSNPTLTELEDSIEIEVDVCNSSSVGGAEVVQIYSSINSAQIFAPKRELREFCKVYLRAKESKRVSIKFNKDELCYYDIKRKEWILKSGDYDIHIAASSTDIKYTLPLSITAEEVDSPYSEEVLAVYKNAELSKVTNTLFEEMSRVKIPENPTSLPLTPESRFCDFNLTFFGRLIRNTVMYFLVKRPLKKAMKLDNKIERENHIKASLFLEKMLDTNSIITMAASSSGLVPYNVALGVVDIANAKIFRGLKKILTRTRVPRLPEEQNK